MAIPGTYQALSQSSRLTTLPPTCNPSPSTMSSSPTFQHTSPLVPKKALAHQNGHQNGHDSYDATPPSTPPAPCRSSPPLNRNAKPGVWNLRLKSRSSLFNHISVTSQPNTHSTQSLTPSSSLPWLTSDLGEYLSLSGQDTANSASALEVDKLKELCQTEYESRQVSG